MSSGSIKISELNYLPVVTGVDYFPLVQSASFTTYRTDINILNVWTAASGSARSASYALSASNAETSSYALSASQAGFSISASHAISASQALIADFVDASTYTVLYANSASWASSSISASYAPFTAGTTVPSASWASSSISASYALSASFAPSSTSDTASYAISASIAQTASYFASSASPIKAFGMLFMASASKYTTIKVLSQSSYNVENAVITSSRLITGSKSNPMEFENTVQVQSMSCQMYGTAFIVRFLSPLPTPYYTVVANYWGFESAGATAGPENIAIYTNPKGNTIYGFTMSFSGGDNTSGEGKYLGGFSVFHP